MVSTRYVGIQHRVKKTADNEAHPTRVTLLHNGKPVTIELPDERAELDFVEGCFPIKHRKATTEDNLTTFRPWQLKTKRIKQDVDVSGLPENLVLSVGKERFLVTQVPASFNGLQTGDVVAMVLGGSGDRLAFALSHRAEEIGASIWRTPPRKLKEWREGDDKTQDALVLAQAVRGHRDDFYEVEARDRKLIAMIECLHNRTEAMKARIGCGQRLNQVVLGRIFCSPEGHYPQGDIELLFEKARANDAVFQALLQEEKAREKELKQAVHDLLVWQKIFEPIEGCGELIAARLIAAIQDIRRFPGKPQLKSFCGVHVASDGTFVRRRRGQLCNWHPVARQALFLIGDQCNRRKDSFWGQKLREYKRILREKHPEVVVVNGKKKYTDGHIHKMALWRTITKFVEALWRDWTRLEREHQEQQKQQSQDAQAA